MHATLLSQGAPIVYGSDTEEGADPVDNVYFYTKETPWKAIKLGNSDEVITIIQIQICLHIKSCIYIYTSR